LRNELCWAAINPSLKKSKLRDEQESVQVGRHTDGGSVHFDSRTQNKQTETHTHTWRPFKMAIQSSGGGGCDEKGCIATHSGGSLADQVESDESMMIEIQNL
jgi:hypothetical protein